ncbi:MAG: AmmeMemoRadiSam system radical SAM enzyme, partial [Bacteroidetes bacterium]|nr:AmmeMemoRadiSam system radical SAM enzyme [Bacteroidota bacterium]
YTYSDPIAFYEYTYDTAMIAREKGIKNVFISAGYINETPLREIAKYLDGANIDLKSFDNKIYEMLNAGTLEPVLKTLQVLKDEGVWLEITNLIVPTWTDDLDMIKRMCSWLVSNGFEDTPLHFSRFHPMYKLTNLPSTPQKTLKDAHAVALSEGMHYVYIGNVPGSGAENTICHHCGDIAVERKGYSILSNNITNGKCNECGGVIPGIWD